MYYAIAYLVLIALILLWFRGAHVDDMDDTTLSELGRWELRAGELRKVLALIPDDPRNVLCTRQTRVRVAAQLANCEKRIKRLTQRSLFDA